MPRRRGGDPQGRLLEACVEVVGRRGWDEAKIVDICLLAEVSTQTFYRCFATKEACFQAAVEARGSELLARGKEAFDATPAPWEQQILATLSRLLQDLAADEPLARVLAVEVPRAGAAGPAGLAVLVDQAKRLFAPHETAPQPPVHGLEKVIVGTVLYPVSDYVGRDSVDRLPELAPVLTYFLVLFLVGSDRALELADGLRSQRSRNGLREAHGDPGVVETG